MTTLPMILIHSLVNGNWSPWSEWTGCSRSCQPGGFRSRTRACSSPLPRCGGDLCPGDAVEMQPCNTDTTCKFIFLLIQNISNFMVVV